MSGHSHWSTIKHRKEAQDKKRGAIFSRMARLISLAVREKGSDSLSNFELRSAIERARALNMPNKNIERAVERGAGCGDREEWFKVSYEAFGPGQTALIIEGITDNKNRTIDEIKKIVAQHGGKMAETGSVRWLFQYLGRMTVPGDQKNKDLLELKAIEADAIETKWTQGDLEVYVKPEGLEKSKEFLEKNGFVIKEHSFGWIASEEVEISEEEKKRLNSLLEDLGGHDDVQEVYFNAKL